MVELALSEKEGDGNDKQADKVRPSLIHRLPTPLHAVCNTPDPILTTVLRSRDVNPVPCHGLDRKIELFRFPGRIALAVTSPESNNSKVSPVMKLDRDSSVTLLKISAKLRILNLVLGKPDLPPWRRQMSDIRRGNRSKLSLIRGGMGVYAISEDSQKPLQVREVASREERKGTDQKKKPPTQHG